MRVCAEFEDAPTAIEAHKHLVDQGLNPTDIEIRSPYPLAEAPIPPHRSAPMWLRTVVRCMWAIGLTCGFIFVSYTQFEWAPVSVTNGHPLIPPPITMVVTYECGMITAILTTTFMFFLETFRYRQLVPPIEEDLPVGIGYIVVVVRGASAERALKLFEGKGARSVVTYALMFLLLGSLTGCARNNMREQDVIKTTEQASEVPPEHSRRMPSAEEQLLAAPGPFASLNYGDVTLFERWQAAQAKVWGLSQVSALKPDQKDALKQPIADAVKARTEVFNQLKAEDGQPTLFALKDTNTVPADMTSWKNPMLPTIDSLDRGKHLFEVNCAACHGLEGKGDGKVGEVLLTKPIAIGTDLEKANSDGYIYYYIATGKTIMPPFGYRLTNNEICDIINHLRRLQGTIAGPVTGTPSLQPTPTPAPTPQPEPNAKPTPQPKATPEPTPTPTPKPTPQTAPPTPAAPAGNVPDDLKKAAAARQPGVDEVAKMTAPANADVAKGKEIYSNNCVSCHGTEGKGDGPLAPTIATGPPRDLTAPATWKYDTSVRNIVRTDKFGIPGTGMAPLPLKDEDLWNVAAYLKTIQK